MAAPNNIVFQILDNTNTPVTGLSLTFSVYKDLNNTAITPPAITEIGGGFYEFIPVFSTNTGICYLINTGHVPAIINGYVRPEDFPGDTVLSPQAIVFLVVDNTLTPVSGLSLTFTTYEDNNGNPVLNPAILGIGTTGFYKFIVAFPSDNVGIAYSINTSNNPIVVNGYVRVEDFAVVQQKTQVVNVAIPQVFAPTVQSVNLGQDTYDLDDLPLIDTQVISIQNLSLRIARRLQTPYGALGAINDDADFGYDVYQLLNAPFDQNDIMAAIADIENEVLKEEEIQTATVDITKDAGAQTAFSITVDCTSSLGPFNLVLNIGDVTYNTLTINEQ